MAEKIASICADELTIKDAVALFFGRSEPVSKVRSSIHQLCCKEYFNGKKPSQEDIVVSAVLPVGSP